MSKKKKNKDKKKDKKGHPEKDGTKGKLKSKCCEKYKKGEDKRCKRCPGFDLVKKEE
ncbi:hypothetical protein ACFX5E_05070 [Flavobacterium sp. LS2P90]|uniref:Uncharacterized protein n=1 Tax=Flavobacterium xylosi TaxID=3230415 RepID=A0ABW6HTX5_9FLAO